MNRKDFRDSLRRAIKRTCQCTDGHHDGHDMMPYGTDDSVRMGRDAARALLELLNYDAEVDSYRSVVIQRDEYKARLAAVQGLVDGTSGV